MNQHEPEWLSIVREKVETLRYGVVQIVIHDSKVTLTRLQQFSDRPETLKGSPTPEQPTPDLRPTLILK